MRSREVRCGAVLCIVMGLMLVPAALFAQYSWGDVAKAAQRIEVDPFAVEGDVAGAGFGEVAEGFASFSFDLTYTGPLTIEVSVTEVRPGAGYEDDDSMLFLFDRDGYILDENDDSPFGGLASLLNGTPIDEPGRYYAVVTTLPNSPEIDSYGRFAGLGDEGGSSIAFDLIIEYGEREGEYIDYDDPGYYDDWGGETVYWFDEIREMARPVFYEGGELIVGGAVSSGIAAYRVEVPETLMVGMEVVVTAVDAVTGLGDSVLFVFDADGAYVAEDDDGGYDGASRLAGVYLEPSGPYYVVVTTYPNFPNIDDFGYLEGFPDTGESTIEFDLVFAPGSEYDGYAYDDYGAAEPYPDDGVPANSFRDIVSNAQRIPIANMRGIGAGEVGIGYAAFEIEVNQPLYATIEVMITEVRQGVSYQDSDSMLFVFDSAGVLLAEDDDGGVDGASKVQSVWFETPGRYYAVVTTYPNDPAIVDGVFRMLDTYGESNIGFDLVVRLDTAAM